MVHGPWNQGETFKRDILWSCYSCNSPLKFSIKSAHCQWERDVFNIGLGLKNVARDIVTVVDKNVEREIVLVVLTSNLRN